MVNLAPIMLIVAFVCFLIAAAGIPSRINLVALGLAFWVLVQLIPLFPIK